MHWTDNDDVMINSFVFDDDDDDDDDVISGSEAAQTASSTKHTGWTITSAVRHQANTIVPVQHGVAQIQDGGR